MNTFLVRTVGCTIAFAIAVVGLTAQSPDLSGTWKLNRASSQIATGVGLAGLGAGGAPNTIYVTQAANGTMTIGSDHNQGMARAYHTGGESSIPAAPSGTVAVKSRWDGSTFVVEAAKPEAGPAALRETFQVSADGNTLTVTVSSTSSSGPATTTLVYAKALVESPCKSWPTPCR